MHRATLLTSDSDFVPLIDALVKEGMFVTLWYPPRDTNIDLIAAADGKIPLRVDSVYDHLIPTDKELFQIPQVTTEPARGDFAPVLTEWVEVTGQRMRICEFAGRFTAELLDTDKSIGTYATHTDRALLENYIRDIWPVSVPAAPEQQNASAAVASDGAAAAE